MRTQVSIDGVGRVDVLIGDRLVLELERRSHHLADNYRTDRARDLEPFRQGFTVLRVSYRRVMYDWPAVEEAILTAIRRGDQLRRGIHARLGLARAWFLPKTQAPQITNPHGSSANGWASVFREDGVGRAVRGANAMV